MYQETISKEYQNEILKNNNIEKNNLFYFPYGLVGIDKQLFYLSSEDKLNKNFKYLNSLNSNEIKLLTLELPVNNEIIDYKIISKIIEDLEQIKIENAKILFIVTSKDKKISLNKNTPIIIDTKNNIGYQLVI